MKHYYVHRSNRAEVLVEALAKTLQSPLADAVTPEVIVVQGRGMGVWLSLQLARIAGVWANADFVYPRHFVRRAFDWVLEDTKFSATDYSRQRMFWALLSDLPEQLAQPELAPLSNYLTGDHQGRRLFSLCERIADTFDHYLTYRPDMLLKWQRGRPAAPRTSDHQLRLFQPSSLEPSEEPWQPIVWRALVKRLGPNHLAKVEAAFLAATQDEHATHTLPERIHVFGLSSLPPLYLRVLMAMAVRTNVYLYQLSPSRQYWADLALGRGKREAQSSLLSSLGQLGAEFSHLLQDYAERLQVHDVDAQAGSYREPEGSHLLARLQRSMLDAQRIPAHELDTDDDSIQIHACHSPMREAEVVHAQILDLIGGKGGYEPQDIVVLTPDIETYAPFIDAVFDRESDITRRIPYHVADRSLSATSPVIEAFFRVLVLSEERVSAPQVLDLLANDEVRAAFDLSVDDVERITTWVTETNIRWGIDEQHRARFGLAPNAQNTWQFGLRRLLLGYAQPTAHDTLDGVLPYPEVEGQSAQLVGALAEFCDKLFGHVMALTEPRRLSEWQVELSRLLADLFKPGAETARQVQRIQQALANLVEVSTGADFDAPIHAWQVRELLQSAIDDAEPARGFLTGGVTFCAMVPMRAIPFKVVCLLGMNDRAFPRRDRPNEFDVTQRSPRQLGDRSRRIDDRYLFLETLLSARDKLIVTYVGQSLKDNSDLPPSVLVSELVDALVALHTDASSPEATASLQEQLQRHLIVRHPLQPFSPRYFDAANPKLFSYEQAYVHGARQLASLDQLAERPAFFERLLDQEPTEPALGLDDLARFMTSPVRHLLNQRLDVWLRDEEYDVPDREPHELSPLEGYAAGNELLGLLLEGTSEEQARRLIRSTGSLQLGTPGELESRLLFGQAHQLATAIAESHGRGRAAPLRFERSLKLDEPFAGSQSDVVTLRGELVERFVDEAGRTGIRRGQYARVRAKALVDLWVRHLAHCWRADFEIGKSVIVGRAMQGDAVFQASFRPVAKPERHLAEMIRLYCIGRRAPLAFFPTASLAFAAGKLNGEEPDKALRAAQAAFGGELASDAHYLRAFGSEAHLDLRGVHDRRGEVLSYGPDFAELAVAYFGPLLEHLEVEQGLLKSLNAPPGGWR